MSKTYSMPNIPRPIFTQALKIQFVNYTSETTHWLKDKLEQAGIEIEIEEISFREAVYEPNIRLEADLFIHGEIFEMNQTFSYLFFLKNSYSPLQLLTNRDAQLQKHIQDYEYIPFENWNDKHMEIERYLQGESLCIPLYYVKRRIPFSISLMNIEIKHFGYVDLTKLWVKPRI